MPTDAVERARRLRDGLEQYARWTGGVHDQGCPEDDTCDCSGKPANDAINDAVRYFDALVRGAVEPPAVTHCPDCGHDWFTPASDRRCGKPHCFCQSCQIEAVEPPAIRTPGAHQMTTHADETRLRLISQPQIGLIKQWRKQAETIDDGTGVTACSRHAGINRKHADELEAVLVRTPGEAQIDNERESGVMPSDSEASRTGRESRPISAPTGAPVTAGAQHPVDNTAPGAAREPWHPMETAPRDHVVFFWVRAKTADETYRDTSGRPILSTSRPHLHRGRFGTWGALETATQWTETRDPDPPTTEAREDARGADAVQPAAEGLVEHLRECIKAEREANLVLQRTVNTQAAELVALREQRDALGAGVDALGREIGAQENQRNKDRLCAGQPVAEGPQEPRHMKYLWWVNALAQELTANAEWPTLTPFQQEQRITKAFVTELTAARRPADRTPHA